MPVNSEAYHQKLLAMRRRVNDELGRMLDRIPDEVSPPGEHELVPSQDVDTDILRTGSEQQILNDVNSALERIENGTFGRCVQCGRDIAPARLEAIPYTPFCIDCARNPQDIA